MNATSATTATSVATGGPAASRGRSRWPRMAFAWSLACTTLGLWWVVDPAAYPLDDGVDPEPVSLLDAVGPRAGAAVCLAVGLIGMLTAAVLARATPAGRPARAAVVSSGVLAALLLVVAPDVQVLSVLGYAMALLGPPVVVTLLVAGARRHPRNLVVVALLALAVAVGVAAGEVGAPTVELLGQIRDGLGRVGIRPLVVGLLAGGGVLFGLCALAATDGTARGRWLARWGRTATVVAALGPVPYGLLRLTWLTPWPQGLGPGEESMLDGGVRVFGLCLGLAALCGAWLTTGLLARWGEVWPGWLPGLRGRPVPVAAAVVPATVVGAALCASSVSLVLLAVQTGRPDLLLFFPTPVWGPALLLATWAYHHRRTAGAAVSVG
ncbi:MAG: hypothetical protein ACRCZD_11635 [Phycicoccus sp.]